MTTALLTVADICLIEQQLNKIIQAKATSKDNNIISTVKGLAVSELREKLKNADETILTAVENISDQMDAELFLNSLKAYTIPFKAISEAGLQKLFRKEKKLKLPKLEEMDWHSISYLSWIDAGTHRQYIVLENDGQYTALRGVADTHKHIKGVCAICNHHSDVHLFTATVKGNVDAYTSYSNYICKDIKKCNKNLSNYKRLEAFVARNLV